MHPTGLVVTDLDGTLMRSDGTIHSNDLKTLEDLGTYGIVRAIATGRSLYSFSRSVDRPLPVDFIIFSTGAAILKYPEGVMMRSVNLEAREVQFIIRVFKQHRLHFMVHRGAPDNHLFAYHQPEGPNPDFVRRIELYHEVCWPLDSDAAPFDQAAQVIAVVPETMGDKVFNLIQEQLDEFNVIRTTSPLDGASMWIEVFPKNVSKSLSTAWLASELGIDAEYVMAVGNDYNDMDLLLWSGASYVVDNAPEDLKRRFASVASNDNAGVTEAVNRWLGLNPIQCIR
ncbi:MAG: HAD family hydrolase [Desulfobacterales bacterium]|nr:HAD family hydrolase [Desulfobacterales bacterium]MDD4071129.1 HAD family hydrolase [Desulfobacterales bacterium]